MIAWCCLILRSRWVSHPTSRGKCSRESSPSRAPRYYHYHRPPICSLRRSSKQFDTRTLYYLNTRPLHGCALAHSEETRGFRSSATATTEPKAFDSQKNYWSYKTLRAPRPLLQHTHLESDLIPPTFSESHLPNRTTQEFSTPKHTLSFWTHVPIAANTSRWGV